MADSMQSMLDNYDTHSLTDEQENPIEDDDGDPEFIEPPPASKKRKRVTSSRRTSDAKASMSDSGTHTSTTSTRGSTLSTRTRAQRKSTSSAAVDSSSDVMNAPIPPEDQLPLDWLVGLSTEEFDAWVARLRAARDVTADEEATLRTLRRRIRNRESARDSRSNKKNYLQSLQARVDTLKQHNNRLHLQIHSLQSENRCLKEEALFLQEMIRKNPPLNALFNTLVTAAVMGSQLQGNKHSGLSSSTPTSQDGPDFSSPAC